MLRTLVPELVAALDRSPVDAMLAKLTRATLAVSPLELVSFFKDPTPNALARPGALIVDEATLPMARETCGRLAELGVVRAAFTDASAASQWAREMGELVRAERAWEERRLARYALSLQFPPAQSARKPQGSTRKRSASHR
jgi:hypothetical protein